MKIVLDESLGLHSLESEKVEIKPIKIKSSDRFEDFLDKCDSKSLLSKKVPIADWRLDEEIAYFIDRFPKGSKIVYFYDPYVQPEDELKKLRNWLMHDRYLIPIAAPNNRALVYLLVDQVQSLPNLTKQEVTRWVEGVKRSVTGTIISQKPTIFSGERIHRTYRTPKNEIYKRASWKYNSVTIEESGKLSDVMETGIKKDDESLLWVVKKGVSISLAGDHERSIPNHHLPVNIPFIHIARIPITNPWGEHND